MKIYGKLMILSVSLVLFTAIILAIFADQKVEHILQDEIVTNITQQAEGTSRDIARFISSRINDVKLAANNPKFRTVDSNTKELNRAVSELESLNDLYYSFSYFDMERNRLADSKLQSIGERHRPNLYWEFLKDHDAVVDVSKSESANELVMHFAAKTFDIETNVPIGVLVSRILVEDFFEVVGNIYLGSDSTRKLDIHLVDENGLILYTDENHNELVNQYYKDFPLVKNVDHEGVNHIDTEDTFYFITRETSLLSFTGNKWTLFLSIPKSKAFSPLKDVRSRIVYTVIPVVVFSIGLALLLAHFFTKPIIELSKVAEEMGRGKLDQKNPVKSMDEVGVLAKQLVGSGKQLIKRIEQQTLLNKKLHVKNHKIQLQNNLLEEYSKQINDSIAYARQMVDSILPSKESLKSIFTDSFVIYKPKDVIGGDFYWYERIIQGNKEYMVIACADSTGHGIPGAIMSIMGINIMTNIVYYQNYKDPSKIIARLDRAIKMELRDTIGENRDGMEIGIGIINLKTLEMEYSGVGIPLRILRNNSNELEVFKVPRLMAGGIEGGETDVQSKIEMLKIQLKRGDKIYLATDGFQDQFGGEKDRKYMQKNFNQLIEQTSKIAMDKQGDTIIKTFDTWSQNTEQTDDMTLLGVRI